LTPEKHNKTLGICHIAYGSLHMLMMLAMIGFFWFIFSVLPPDGRGDAPPPEMFAFFGIFLAIYTIIFSLPAFVAGYALLKHKPWARIASIVAACVEAMNVPFGTAVCVYSFWFMFSDAGKQMYDAQSGAPNARASAPPQHALHDAEQRPADSWWHDHTGASRAGEYAPPQPPNWRDG
jgi:hypothetical protein